MNLQDISTVCFQGVFPSSFFTCSRDGIPNAIFLSHIYLLDEKHVAVSCQFFNKTEKNLQENPVATAIVVDPQTFTHFELQLRWRSTEHSGPIFDKVADRIKAIEAQMKLKKIYKLKSIEIFEVESILDQGTSRPRKAPPSAGRAFTLANLQQVIKETQDANGLVDLFDRMLTALDRAFGFKYSMILLPEKERRKLVVIASHGYSPEGIGSEVTIGEGIIGQVAFLRKPVRSADLRREITYVQAAQKEITEAVTVPGNPNALSQIAIPLIHREKLLGVLSFESLEILSFDESDEEFLTTLGLFLACAMENIRLQHEEVGLGKKVPEKTGLHITYYPNDETIFVNGEYLIKNIPAKLLWKLLQAYRAGQNEFTNKELRLDSSLNLPEVKDNLEARLILLRKRLEQKCPQIKMASTGRGRFCLQIPSSYTLETH